MGLTLNPLPTEFPSDLERWGRSYMKSQQVNSAFSWRRECDVSFFIHDLHRALPC